MNSLRSFNKNSLPQRYEFSTTAAEVLAHPQGEYVKFSDYERVMEALRDLSAAVKPSFLWEPAIDANLRTALSSALIDASQIIERPDTEA